MFDARELGIIISGSSAGFDVADLKQHTVYNGGFTDRVAKGAETCQSPEVVIRAEVFRLSNERSPSGSQSGDSVAVGLAGEWTGLRG